MDNNFANNLKHLRVQAGMTQEELAKKINKDYSTIGKWELGQRSPIMSDIVKLADIFNVPLNTLVTDDFTKINEPIDETEILFNKYKDHLTDKDKMIIKTILEETKKEIDEEQGED